MLRRTLLLLSLVLLPAPVVLAEPALHLMANTSPPYADRQLPEEGLAVELLTHLFGRTDYPVEITIDNWSRAVEGARLGVYDGLAAAWYSKERAGDLLYSEPYLDGELIILSLRSDRRPYRSLADLAGKRLGVQTEYAYGVDFDAIDGLTLVPENHVIQSLLKLQTGKVDAIIGDKRTVIGQLHEYLDGQINKFHVTSIKLPARPRHVAISRELEGHEKMIAAFNEALVAARKDGSVQAIIKKWDERYSRF